MVQVQVCPETNINRVVIKTPSKHDVDISVHFMELQNNYLIKRKHKGKVVWFTFIAAERVCLMLAVRKKMQHQLSEL